MVNLHIHAINLLHLFLTQLNLILHREIFANHVGPIDRHVNDLRGLVEGKGVDGLCWRLAHVVLAEFR